MELKEKSAYRWAMLILLLIINLQVDGAAVTSLSAVFPTIAKEFKLNYSQISVIWAAIPLGVLLFCIIGGILADRFAYKKVLSVSLLWTAVFGGLRGFSSSYESLLICNLLMGMGIGVIVPNLSKGVAMWFGSRELSRANGILYLGVTVGMGLGLALGVPCASLVGGWRNLMLLLAVINIAIFIMWIAAARERDTTGAESSQRPPMWDGMHRVFKVKEIWLISFVEFITIGGLMAASGILPTFMVSKGMSDAEAGLFTSLGSLASIVGLIVGPYFSDKIGLRKIFTWPLFLIIAVTAPLLAILWNWPLYMAAFLSGFCHGCALPQLRSIVIELEEIGPKLAGSAFGGIFTFNRIGAFLIPLIVGNIMTITGKPIAGFIFIGVINLIPVILMQFVRETGQGAKALKPVR
ncbi:nitrate/nitrite transporter [Desulfosporosinus sp. BICA1-9]|uniref:MFS transporter n=1 Tax=Desulfosporosinus sp. BICA1-9 TaxID=1531958 RepID=UPI00054BC821|nr:MFS transporter [Desulfosporosinus sp. BICA1-9]KJS46085.1 MAG: hypothetical protein VR66_27305 [Peptococcaceae bacterium BRH_c23]KJS88542.1 MAG: hypothetical protein JL57_12045 [Desulfosporosinus sp. BICA1-9]HBW35130.1 MFS transporter [Desulfosporosinus sp.]